MKKIKKEKGKSKKWNWILTESYNLDLTEEEISDVINKKLAYIIIELEHNQINYLNVEKSSEMDCQTDADTV